MSLGSNIASDIVKRFVDSILSSTDIVGNRVTKAVCERILSEWKSDNSSAENAIYLIKAIDVSYKWINQCFFNQTPKFKYNRNMGKFVLIKNISNEDMNSLLPFSPLTKSFLFSNRYEVVYQRVVRNTLFADESKGFKLRPIEFLLSSGSKAHNNIDDNDEDDINDRSLANNEKPNVIILGCLVQLKNAQWYLEDVTNLVKLDFSQTRFHQVISSHKNIHMFSYQSQGVFPEGSVVLTEGWYDEDAELFRATGIGLPPVERPMDTRRYFSVSNPFGGGAQGIDGAPASFDKRMSRFLDASPVSIIFI